MGSPATEQHHEGGGVSKCGEDDDDAIASLPVAVILFFACPLPRSELTVRKDDTKNSRSTQNRRSLLQAHISLPRVYEFLR